MGELDPFEMASRLSKRVFIYWRMRKKLNFSTFHTKDEYYWAGIHSCLKTSLDGEPRNTGDSLIGFKETAEVKKEAEAEQEKQDRLFMASVVGHSERINKNG